MIKNKLFFFRRDRSILADAKALPRHLRFPLASMGEVDPESLHDLACGEGHVSHGSGNRIDASFFEIRRTVTLVLSARQRSS